MEISHLEVPDLLVPTMLHLLTGTSIILVAALVLSLAHARSSAAVRHRTWSLSVAATLLLPAFILLSPQWRLSMFAASSSIIPANQSLPMEAATLHSGMSAQGLERSRHRGSSAHQNPEVLRESLPQDDMTAAAGSLELQLSHREHFISGVVHRAESLATQPVMWLAIWCIGVLLSLIPLLRSMLVMQAICGRASQLGDGACADLVTALAWQMSLRREPPVLQTADFDSPVCVGWRRPVVLLPNGWQFWPEDHLRAALAHELAHIRRGDVAWQLLARMACAFYWMHPMIWIAAWRMRVERETACDDRVLEMGEKPVRYARLLLRLAAEVAQRGAASSSVAVAMATTVPIERRIRAILRSDLRRGPVGRRVGNLLALATAAVMVLAGITSPFGPSDSRASAGTGNEVRGATADEGDSSPLPTDKAGDRASHLGVVEKEEDKPQKEAAENVWHIRGRVVDEQKQPIAGARVEAIAIGFFHPVTRTATDGSFTLQIPVRRSYGVLVRAQHHDAQLQGAQAVQSPRDDKVTSVDVVLQLRPARELIARVVDASGAVVEDATVAVKADQGTVAEARTGASGEAVLQVPDGLPLRHILAVKPHVGLDYFAFWREGEPISDPYRLSQDHGEPVTMVLDGVHTIDIRVMDSGAEQPLADVSVYPTSLQKPRKGTAVWLSSDTPGLYRKTNTSGLASFPVIPINIDRNFVFSVSLAGYGSKRLEFNPDAPRQGIVTQLAPTVRVTGRVLDVDGMPAAGATVRAVGNDYNFDGFTLNAQASLDGGFELHVPADHYFSFVAEGERTASWIHTRWIRQGDQVEALDLSLKPATRVFGRATIGPQARPVANQYVWLLQDAHPPSPKVHRRALTNDEGRFEIFAGPGSYSLRLPGTANGPKFIVNGENPIELDVHAEVPHSVRTAGRVVLQGDETDGVAEAVVTGIPRQDRTSFLNAVSNGGGYFVVDRARSNMVVHAATPNGRLAGVVEIGADAVEIVVPIAPTGAARGRLIDVTSGRPLAGRQVECRVRVQSAESETFVSRFGSEVATNSEGRFSLSGLAVGPEYTLSVVADWRDDGKPRSWRTVGTVELNRPTTVDLGDIRMEPSAAMEPEPQR